MDTQIKVETLREKALRMAKEEMQARAQKTEIRERKEKESRKEKLEYSLKIVFGDDVIYTISDDDVRLCPVAVVADFPELTFRVNHDEYPSNQYLRVEPTLNAMPGGEEYEEWFENPANSHLVLANETVGSLSEVGDLLERWSDLDRTVKPWSNREPKAPSKPDRFAKLFVGAASYCVTANSETRPFKVLGVTTDHDGDAYIVVEYTDIDTPDGER